MEKGARSSLHKLARMDGGSDKIENLAAACLHCNQHRGQQKNTALQKRAVASGQVCRNPNKSGQIKSP
ncbi:HNH endonuclease [Devosia insulae]|uniref:HNH endonuclease n=1 Tax=Devosia insulae TaxID=408174 RepID=UPI000A03799C